MWEISDPIHLGRPFRLGSRIAYRNTSISYDSTIKQLELRGYFDGIIALDIMTRTRTAHRKLEKLIKSYNYKYTSLFDLISIPLPNNQVTWLNDLLLRLSNFSDELNTDMSDTGHPLIVTIIKHMTYIIKTEEFFMRQSRERARITTQISSHPRPREFSFSHTANQVSQHLERSQARLQQILVGHDLYRAQHGFFPNSTSLSKPTSKATISEKKLKALNKLQETMLESFLQYPLSDVVDTLVNQPEWAIKALQAIIAKDNLPSGSEDVLFYKNQAVWDSMQQIRTILLHPCPQNRSIGSDYVAQEPGYAVWEPDGHGLGIAKEPLGLLGLTTNNNSQDKSVLPVTKQAVVDYITEQITKTIEIIQSKIESQSSLTIH